MVWIHAFEGPKPRPNQQFTMQKVDKNKLSWKFSDLRPPKTKMTIEIMKKAAF